MVVPLCFDSRRDPFICVSLVVTLNIFYYGRDPRSFLVYPFGRDPDVFYFGRDPSFVVLSSFFLIGLLPLYFDSKRDPPFMCTSGRDPYAF